MTDDQMTRIVVNGTLIEIGPREGSEGEPCIVFVDPDHDSEGGSTYLVDADGYPIQPETLEDAEAALAAMGGIISTLLDTILIAQDCNDVLQKAHVTSFFDARQKRLTGAKSNQSKADKTRALAEQAVQQARSQLQGAKQSVVVDRAYELFIEMAKEKGVRGWSRRYFESQV